MVMVDVVVAAAAAVVVVVMARVDVICSMMEEED